MEPIIENALRDLIITEKNNVDFFRHAAGMVRDDRVRQVFELLASDGIGYMNVYLVCLGRNQRNYFVKLLKLPPDPNYPPYFALVKETRTNACERQTLEISLREVLASINFYTNLANGFRNQKLFSIYERALRKAYKHYVIIHAEYIRILGAFNSSFEEVPV